MSEPIAALPTLRQLTYLLALEEHQHFSRAAAACLVAQPTLSSAIAELERVLGAQLVDRPQRTLRFTEVGTEVARRAREVVRVAEDLREVAQDAQERLVGSLRLAAIPTIAPFLLPCIVQAVGKRWPRLRLVVREMLTGAACDALQRNAVDCVLLALPAECGDVERYEIALDPLLVATRDGEAAADAHALTSDPSRLLLLDEGHCLRDQALAACNLKTASPEALLVASTLQTLVQMVDAGLGVTLLPQIAVTAGILNGTQVSTKALAPGASRRIALVWRRRSPRASDLSHLGETIRQAVLERALEPSPERR